MKNQFRILAELSALALAACGGSSGLDAVGKGQVSIAFTSSSAGISALTAPAGSVSPIQCPAVSTASVTLSSIVARTLDAKLVEVTGSLPINVDLLALAGGKAITLSDGFLPPGTYDQLVVVMTRLEWKTISGMKIAITPPSAWTAIVPVATPFTVVAGQTTNVTLQLRWDLSFLCGICGTGDFKPPEFDWDGEHCDGQHGAADQLESLLRKVNGVGPGTSLVAKISQAQADVAAKDIAGACGTLTGFINEVQAQEGKKIDASTALGLILDASTIKSTLCCP